MPKKMLAMKLLKKVKEAEETEEIGVEVAEEEEVIEAVIVVTEEDIVATEAGVVVAGKMMKASNKFKRSNRMDVTVDVEREEEGDVVTEGKEVVIDQEEVQESVVKDVDAVVTGHKLGELNKRKMLERFYRNHC